MKPQFSFFYRSLIGIGIALMTLALYLSVKPIDVFSPKVINSLIISLTAYFSCAISVSKFSAFPGKQSLLRVLPAVLIAYSIVFWLAAAIFLTFSNSFVLVNGIFCVLFFSVEMLILGRKKLTMGYIPTARAQNAQQIEGANWVKLSAPKLPANQHLDAIVADLYDELDENWQRFLTNCALRNIPVYHIRQVEESLSGRVKIRHLYENDLGALLPSSSYLLIKRIWESALIILSLPITLPLMLVTALAIALESRGNIVFTQKRIGLGGKEFTIYKFRSMRVNSEQNGAQFAQNNDVRITRVGQFIRKCRLDELPQFFNILKGEMSLIGPRPEQQIFVEEFKQKIPFYDYRHIVRPGLSGWAQVRQGYASNEDETQIKLEHDFYYIKHFSFALDILIFFKTIKTIFTGFGAR